MANRFVLNETSYHGAGAIKEIVTEFKARGFKKAFVASDPDLVKFCVTAKVTDLLDAAGIDYTVYSYTEDDVEKSCDEITAQVDQLSK